MGLFNALMGNVSDTDISAIQKEYEPLLCEGENIERAYSHIRDKWVFTNRRLIVQDTQGLTGKKREYLSLPYHSIEFFSIETAGTLDDDAELKIWVKGMDHAVEVNFGNKQALLEVHRLLAHYVL